MHVITPTPFSSGRLPAPACGSQLFTGYARPARFTCIRRQSAALLVAAALAGTAAALIALPASAQAKAVNPYGVVCAQFESGGNPGCVVSGSAYGAYQMSTYHARAFADWLRATYKKKSAAYTFGTTLRTAYKKDRNTCGKRFDQAWRKLAANNGRTFHRYQYLYVKKTHYTPAADYLSRNVKAFKLGKYSKALKNALFSASVQHGAWGAYKIASKAFGNLKGTKKRPAETKLIAEMYKVRAGYQPVKTVRKTIANPGEAVHAISAQNTRYYVSNGLLTAKTAKKLKGKALVNFYSCSGATQVGVYYRLTVSENNAAQALLR